MADTFDAMLEQLERAFDGQRRFVANASHELRTPITTSRTAVDVLDAKTAPTPGQVKAAIERVRHASQRSEALIDGLLLLARTDAELTDAVALDLADIAASVLEELEPQRRTADLLIDVGLDPAPASGDPVLVERLVTNLLENAMKYNRPVGRVVVRAHGGSINTSTRPEGGLEVLVTLAPSARPGAGDHGPAPSRSCSISSS